jgi:type II secretory pathway component PulK
MAACGTSFAFPGQARVTCIRTTLARPRPNRRRGFVLPITVILLALVSVGVALMSQRSDQLRTLVSASRQEQLASVAAHNALAQAMYLSSTLQRRGSRLGSIALDGRYYRTADGTFVSYLDGGALLNLMRARPAEVAGLLRALGVAEGQAAALADTLGDYIDADSLVRVNGAEAAEYASAKLPAPRNGALLTVTELQRIAGWHELDAATLQQVLDHVTLGTLNAVNRNTVKAPVLAALGGANIELAGQLVAQRDAGNPLNIESLPAIAQGSYLAVARYITEPSTTLLITVCPPAVAWCQRSSLTATTDEGASPWHLDYSLRQMRAAPLPPIKQVEALPELAPANAPPSPMTPFGIPQ